MKHTWRWFGPSDPITLSQIRQTGATGVVTALHEFPNGTVWPEEEIQHRRAMIEAAGLTWDVVESIPVSEQIKTDGPLRDAHVAAWAQTVRNLARSGIRTVCYNFMPVLDWTRTDLSFPLEDGAWALRFDFVAFAAFDQFILCRAGATNDYDGADAAAARKYYEGLRPDQVDRLATNIMAGLPGAEESYTLATLRDQVAAYRSIGDAELRESLHAFVKDVVPVAQEEGVALGIHPDDPPRPLLGLPRIMSTADDVSRLLASHHAVENGLTFCTGSFGVRADNDLVDMVRRFGERIHFAHLRSTRREMDPRSFHESYHVGMEMGGDVDMVGVVREIVLEERRRIAAGGEPIPMRPDHGHQLLHDQATGVVSRPGYSLLGRMKGLAELRGIEAAVRRYEHAL